MNIMYYFRHIDSSEALKNDVDQRVATLEPLINKTLPVHVRFSVENNQHTVHIELHARNNNHVYVEETSDDMYKSIDAAFEDLKRVVTREKEKQVDHHVKADPFVANAMAAAAVSYEIEDAEAIDAEEVIHEHQATGH
jgi:putative sigma-54 modulation protein